MRSTFETRLVTLLHKLEAAPICDSAEEAFTLFHQAWLLTNEEHNSPEALLTAWRQQRLCAEHGWQGLNSPVCYRNFDESPSIRIYLHPDGSLVIQRVTPASGSILCAKLGHPRMELAAAPASVY